MPEPEKELHVNVLVSVDTGGKEYSDMQKMRGIEAALSELLSTVRRCIEVEEKTQAAENN